MARPKAAIVDKLIRKNLIDWLGPYGFAVVKGDKGATVVRRRDGIYSSIFCVVRSSIGVAVVPCVHMGFEKTAQVYRHFMMRDPLDAEPLLSADISLNFDYYQKRVNARLECDTEEEVAPMIETLRYYVCEQVLPILENLTEPRAVLQYYLDRDDSSTKQDCGILNWRKGQNELLGLIITRLYAPEHYEPLKKRYQAALDGVIYEEGRRGIDNAIKFLDQDELPTW